MTAHQFKRQVWTAASLTVGLGCALIFGVMVLAGGDWLPGTIIVVASAVGLARAIPVINRLCRQGPPTSSPPGTPAH